MAALHSFRRGGCGYLGAEADYGLRAEAQSAKAGVYFSTIGSHTALADVGLR